jgi:hypothetical protein
MPGEIKRTDKDVTYTITHPDWICEWIISSDTSMPVWRSCILKGDIDPLIDNERVLKLAPGLFNELQTVIGEWIKSGEINARILLIPENKPAFITYIESIIGLKIIT